MLLKEKPPVNPEGVSGLNKNLKTNVKTNNTTEIKLCEEDLKTRKVKDIFDRLDFKPSTKAILQKISNDEDEKSEDVREPQARCIFCNSTNTAFNGKYLFCLSCQKWEDDCKDPRKRLPREETYV